MNSLAKLLLWLEQIMATLIIMWITTVLFILTFTTTLIQYLIMTNELSSKIFIVLNITFEQE